MEKYLTGVQPQGQLVSSLPYFVGLSSAFAERDLEKALVDNIEKFLSASRSRSTCFSTARRR